MLKLASLSQKRGFVFVEQILHYLALQQHSITQKIRFTLFIDFKTNLQETPTYGEIFCEVSTFVSLSQKNGFVFIDQFGIIKTGTNIPWLRRFDFCFLQSSKLIFRKLQCMEKVFGKFGSLLCFPRKMFFYSLSKFYIFEPLTNIHLLRKFDLRFWQTSD